MEKKREHVMIIVKTNAEKFLLLENSWNRNVNDGREEMMHINTIRTETGNTQKAKSPVLACPFPFCAVRGYHFKPI